MGCRKLTYYPDTEPKINTLSEELTTKISSKTLRSSYLFGFNGKELDNEIKGDGNAYDFGARIYDSRLGRWLSLDPLMAKYPHLSPYNFCANNPIMYIDPDGEKFITANKSDAEKVANDWNTEYKLKYNVDDAFTVQERIRFKIVDVNAVTSAPSTWLNIFKKSELKVVRVTDYLVVKNVKSKMNWNTDKYTKAMSEIIDSPKEIKMTMKNGNERVGGHTGGTLDQYAGGRADSPSEIFVSKNLGTHNDPGKFKWGIGMLVMHELLYHIHTLGASEGNPNKMRDYYSAPRGGEHPPGSNQSIGK